MLNFIKNLLRIKAPNAAQTWQQLGNNPQNAYWLFAKPVHLVLQRDTFSLAENVPLPLTADEALAITESLNHHFLADGKQFFWHEQQWFLKLNTNPNIQTSEPKAAFNQDITKYLPQGDGAMQWATFQNELQMLLFSHPVNGARELAKQPLVNSLWFHGGGQITK